MALRGPEGPQQAAEKDRAVLAALTEPLSYSEWFQASDLRSKGTFNRTVQRLVTAGSVERTGDRKYRPTGGSAQGSVA